MIWELVIDQNKKKLATGIVEILPTARVFVILGLPDFQP